MKDIWKMNDGEVIDITQWMAKAILNQAMADSGHRMNCRNHGCSLIFRAPH